MSMLKDFEHFALRGNVVDLAVGVIVGAAFGRIVDSLVKDIQTPVIGAIFGGFDFTNYFVMLARPPANFTGPMTHDALTKAGVPLFAYGSFVTVTLNFVILAFIVFQFVSLLNRARRRLLHEAPATDKVPEPTPSETYLKEIRDLLRERQ